MGPSSAPTPVSPLSPVNPMGLGPDCPVPEGLQGLWDLLLSTCPEAHSGEDHLFQPLFGVLTRKGGDWKA